jgi:uncharacterized protein YbcC (UPF0753/DUF2309 family)
MLSVSCKGFRAEFPSSKQNQLNAQVFHKYLWTKPRDQGDIDKNILENYFVDHDFFDLIEEYKHKMVSYQQDYSCDNQELNSIMSKWLFYGRSWLAEWKMPSKEEGFYKAWRSHDLRLRYSQNNTFRNLKNKS